MRLGARLARTSARQASHWAPPGGSAGAAITPALGANNNNNNDNENAPLLWLASAPGKLARRLDAGAR